MPDTKPENPPAERESKQFWVVTEFGEVQTVTGYICEKNPGIWWVPELGFSMTEGHSLFREQTDALEKAITEQAAIASEAQDRLKALNAQMLRARNGGAS